MTTLCSQGRRYYWAELPFIIFYFDNISFGPSQNGIPMGTDFSIKEIVREINHEEMSPLPSSVVLVLVSVVTFERNRRRRKGIKEFI